MPLKGVLLPNICPDFDGALLHFRLFLKLGALEDGGPGELPSPLPPFAASLIGKYCIYSRKCVRVYCEQSADHGSEPPVREA